MQTIFSISHIFLTKLILMLYSLYMNTEVLTHQPMEPGEETSIASSIVPFPWDDSRSVYLSYRACGFSIREALNSIGLSKSALTKWRKDAVFADYENKIPEIRQDLARQYVNIEFLRNMRMVLERDKNILSKALLIDQMNNVFMRKIMDKEMTADEARMQQPFLTKQEQQYLLSLRRNYTPQQLEILDTLVTVGPGQHGTDNNWAAAIAEIARKNKANLELSRTDTIRIDNDGTEKNHNSSPTGSEKEHSQSSLVPNTPSGTPELGQSSAS